MLGDNYSVWRRTPGLGIKYIQGGEPYPTAEAEMWGIVRNPFPPKSEDRSFEILRQQLGITDEVNVLKQDTYNGMSSPQKDRIKTLYYRDFFIILY